jgi:transcriptional regulator with GAF, ATPase, and Fis domain
LNLPFGDEQVTLLAVEWADQHSGVFWFLGRRSFDGPNRHFLDGLLHHLGRAFGEKLALDQTLSRTRAENAELRDTVRRIQHKSGHADYLFESPVMRALLEMVEQVAPTDETVLITGESGTGKEVIARTVHELSKRKDKPLVTVDCAAIPPSLLEAELFGRSKGAYTSADSATVGYIAKAEGGTLLLDEIGELPIDVQAKLLRFLQEREIQPVGSGRTTRVDVRVIAATNRQLEKEVENGRFRRDLFHRLNVLDLKLPPLRERHADVIMLARHFVCTYSQLHGRNRKLSERCEEALLQHSWPGNVRELQHAMLRAVLMTNSSVIEPEDLNIAAQAADSPHNEPTRATDAAPLQATEPQAPGELADRADDGAADHADDPWKALAHRLRLELDSAMGDAVQLPLGSWLADDLIATAHGLSDGNGKRAASLLGIPETTYRRQIDRVSNEQASGLAVRSESWSEHLPPLLTAILRAPLPAHAESNSLVERTRRILLDLVREALPDQPKAGSAYIGVTVPTYKRYLQQLTGAAA